MKTKKIITIGALFIALTLNMQFAFNHYSPKGLLFGTPAYADDPVDLPDDPDEPDTSISGAVKKKYRVTVTQGCFIWCLDSGGRPFAVPGFEDTCKRKVAERENCQKKQCNAKCPR